MPTYSVRIDGVARVKGVGDFKIAYTAGRGVLPTAPDGSSLELPDIARMREMAGDVEEMLEQTLLRLLFLQARIANVPDLATLAGRTLSVTINAAGVSAGLTT